MLNFSSKNIITDQSISVTEAINFLKDDTLRKEHLLSWKKSAESISNSFYRHRITFTTNIFIPITFLCRNDCTYCGYHLKKVPTGQEYIKQEDVEKLLKKARSSGVSEVLITMGDKPEFKYPRAQKWLEDRAYSSTIDYALYIAQRALNHGLLPHINAGSLSHNELAILHEDSASIGLMLEILGTRFSQKGMPHMNSPDKHPTKRLETIKEAGKLKIPFTSGILIGIGESPKEIIASLFTLKNIHKKYNHLQEVIIQNFQPHYFNNMQELSPVSLDFFEKVVIIARHILPPEVSIQVPPNLIKGYEYRFMESGISDWGGISSITHDYINPDHPWPSIAKLQSLANELGYELRERLPVYPQYINLDWLSPRIYNIIKAKNLINKDGYRKRNELSI